MTSRLAEVTVKPHWRHLSEGPYMSFTNLMSPRHLGHALRYSISVTAFLWGGSFRMRWFRLCAQGRLSGRAALRIPSVTLEQRYRILRFLDVSTPQVTDS